MNVNKVQREAIFAAAAGNRPSSESCLSLGSLGQHMRPLALCSAPSPNTFLALTLLMASVLFFRFQLSAFTPLFSFQVSGLSFQPLSFDFSFQLSSFSPLSCQSDLDPTLIRPPSESDPSLIRLQSGLKPVQSDPIRLIKKVFF
jgi:hypothetical protein